MTFDDWMRSERVTYKPSDDSVQDRLLRVCWASAQAAERERWRALLADAYKQTRHPDYDWPPCLLREVDEALWGRVEPLRAT